MDGDFDPSHIMGFFRKFGRDKVLQPHRFGGIDILIYPFDKGLHTVDGNQKSGKLTHQLRLAGSLSPLNYKGFYTFKRWVGLRISEASTTY